MTKTKNLQPNSNIILDTLDNTANGFFEEDLCKTYNLNLNVRKHKLLIEVLLAQCLATKNLTNTALFVVKNIQSSYYPDNGVGIYELKDNLHENQINVLDFVNTHIPYFQAYKNSLKSYMMGYYKFEKLCLSAFPSILITAPWPLCCAPVSHYVLWV